MGDISAAHSKLGASSYSRWGRNGCPGSVKESEGLENVESEYAKEGTLAHSIAERMLRGEKFSETELNTLPDDMVEAITVYLDFVNGHRNPHWQRWIERKFDLTHYHPKFFGTADCVLYHPGNKYLTVIDYKHGKGHAVDVEEDGQPNGQLMYYALGALHELKLSVKAIELVIVQPRAYHADGPVRNIMTTPVDVIDYVSNLIEDAAVTELENPPLKSGDHCRWCPARNVDPLTGDIRCREIRGKPEIFMRENPFQALTAQTGYDPAKLSILLQNLPVMEDYIKAVREFAYREATDGRVPPGFKMVDKRAYRKWASEEKAEFTITQATELNEDDFYTKKFKTVPQVEALLGKKNFAQFERLVVAESSGKTLVPDSDKRKEVTGSVSPFKDISNTQET